MKKNSKRILSLLLATAMVSAFGGCSSSNSASSSAPAASTPAASTPAASSEASAETITLRLGHTQSTEHLVNTTAENFAAMVNEKTGGAVKIDVYPSETLGTNTELAEA